MFAAHYTRVKTSSSSSVHSHRPHGGPSSSGSSAARPFVVPRDCSLLEHTDAYWSNTIRQQLYSLPNDNDIGVWARLTAVQPRGNRVRVLKSANMQGQIIFTVLGDGTARVTDWRYLPELLYLNPVNYFLAHPFVDAIYVETVETDVYTASSGGTDPSAMGTIGFEEGSARTLDSQSTRSSASSSNASTTTNYALVLHRHELTRPLLHTIRALQTLFFTEHNIALPHAREFTCTLHGR